MKNKLEKINKSHVFVVIFLISWLNLFLLREINLCAVDLGRHIKSGEIILETHKIISTNLYSYTYPDFPFTNHHWGGAVILFLVWKLAGFSGLSFFYIVLSLLTFLIFFNLARKNSNFSVAVLASVLAIPLIGERTEIRPEVFSYFFSAVFFWILWNWKRGGISSRWLFALPLIELAWVNSHIYFFLGIGYIGLFWLDEFIQYIKSFKENNVRSQYLKIKKITGILLLTSIVTLINPFGVKLIAYPLNIFRNYGYRVAENQSVTFLDAWGMQNNNLFLIKIVILAIAAGFILLIIANRRRFSWIIFCLAVVFSAMAWMALRNFTLFGFFAIPILAYIFYHGLVSKWNLNLPESKMIITIASFLIFSISAYFYWPRLAIQYDQANLGLARHTEDAAEFFKRENIQGPIFNNYDIGSYLTFYLYPQKVFVDNRPEAYPDYFFSDTYIPMQESGEVFNDIDEKYHFNSVFFYIGDITPWGQKFLTSQINNPDWAPVFANEYSIIFLKRNEINRDIIKRFEIPKSRFGIK